MPVLPIPAVEKQESHKPTFLRVLAWSTLAAIGGALVYSAFTIFTGMEASLIGAPVGLGVGHIMYQASSKRGGRWFQVLAVFLAFLAFDLSYVPGMAGVAFKNGITVVTSAFFVFMTIVSP
jgi:hypothetical protein